MFAPAVEKATARAASIARPRPMAAAPRLGTGAVGRAQLLQRAIGNQAILRLLAQRANSPESVLGAPERTNPLERRFGASGPPQSASTHARLAIGPAEGPLEHEADRVADQVMRMPDAVLSLSAAPAQISRKCDACEALEKLQDKKPEGLQTAAGEAPDLVHEVLRSAGQPLDAATRGFFEPRFGRRLAHIRVHTDDLAAASARTIGARAYTHGSHIVFASGRYETGTPTGRHLLAHELAHTAQQGAANVLQRAVCANYNESSKALCEQQKCVTLDGADGTCKKTGLHVCACFPARMWREMFPTWLLVLLGAAVLAAIAICFATGVCEFAAVVAGLGAAAAAAVMAIMKAAGIRDSGASPVAALDASNGSGYTESTTPSPQQSDDSQQAVASHNAWTDNSQHAGASNQDNGWTGNSQPAAASGSSWAEQEA